jgi:hypothetical protein
VLFRRLNCKENLTCATARAVAVEEPPNRSKPRLLLTLIEQAALDLFQRQIGFTLVLHRATAVARS